MKTKTFSTFEEASQYNAAAVASGSKHSRVEIPSSKDPDTIEWTLTYEDGRQETLLSPRLQTTETLDEVLDRHRKALANS